MNSLSVGTEDNGSRQVRDKFSSTLLVCLRLVVYSYICAWLCTLLLTER